MAGRREISIFNLSFLDVLSCGMGSVMLLSFVFAALPKSKAGTEQPFVTGTLKLSSKPGQKLPRQLHIRLLLLGPAGERGRQIVRYTTHPPRTPKAKDRPPRGVYLWHSKSESQKKEVLTLKFFIIVEKGQQLQEWEGMFSLHGLEEVHPRVGLRYSLCLTRPFKDCPDRSERAVTSRVLPITFRGSSAAIAP